MFAFLNIPAVKWAVMGLALLGLAAAFVEVRERRAANAARLQLQLEVERINNEYETRAVNAREAWRRCRAAGGQWMFPGCETDAGAEAENDPRRPWWRSAWD